VYEIEKSVPVKFRINKPYSVGGNIPLNLEVKFKGVGWNLVRLFTSLNLEFNYEIVPKKKESFVILTKDFLENSLGLSQTLDITSVYPETLFVKIDSYEEKYVKLLPKIQVNCREGYQVVGKPILQPDSIKIGGSAELLRGIDHLNTKYVIFDNVNAGISRSILISDSLTNILSLSQNEVKLNVNIELTAEKVFENIEIKVPNIPEDKEVLLIPQRVSVQLKGGVNQLAQIENSRIVAKIDYFKILSDTTGSVVPFFEIPPGCTVISVKPETIQYVIKKK
jgi:YbbR domain-containing protein